jgi:hypothetical protein
MIPPSTEPSGYVYLDEMIGVPDINIPNNPNPVRRAIQDAVDRVVSRSEKHEPQKLKA